MRCLITSIFILFGFGFVSAQVHLTQSEALALYFPNGFQRKTVFLTEDQVRQIQDRAKARVASRIITYYVGQEKNLVGGYAFFDTQIVRTMPQTFMTIINPDSTIRSVELLAFYEPEDYAPSKRWLATFASKAHLSELWLKRGIQNIVGATLTAQSITDGVRRALATFEIAIPKEKQL
jgi:hypothetical protein